MGIEFDGQEDSRFVAGQNTYAELVSEATASRAGFEQRLEPSPESPEFQEAITSPEFIEDPETGINYAVYRLNKDKEGTPLVVNLAWSIGAESGVGRADLNEFVNHLDRPIVTIDMEGTGKTGIPDRAVRKATTFASLAQSHLRIIDAMGIEKFDIAGYSLGGVVAAGVGAEAGERVGHVITIASPGFEDIGLGRLAKGFAYTENKNMKAYRAEAAEHRPTVLAQDEAAREATSDTINKRNAAMLLRLASLMTESATAEAASQLSSTTKWVDVVGSKDAVTNWRGHLEAIRQRNAEHPHSSSQYILGSETHGVGLHRAAMAEVVAQSLEH